MTPAFVPRRSQRRRLVEPARKQEGGFRAALFLRAQALALLGS
jgi:hypothetical protein